MAGAEEDVKMPLMEHLTELRTRLLYSTVGFVIAFVVCFYFWKPVLDIVTAPLERACLAQGKPCPVIYTSLIEPFFTQVKIGAFAALCITFPLIAAQIYKFLAPGLYKNERMALVPFLVATPIMFAVGATFLYFVLLPLALHFFVGYQQYANIELMPKIGEYIDLVMKLVFAFGLCFELPVILTLLAKVGIVSSQGLRDKRRYAIIIVTVVAAIFTPPDAISMISLAIPMIALYEISIWLAKSVEKKRAAEEAAATESGTEVTPAS
ncbi:twin-arginine translocase subunit TatC [Dongia sedimenti]|uniref:Sec-independent protein translocase protein TatC n=1 Tax=Dongia sedimenti TaxID=3064282 RepID=A0ABU0YKR1_9PROT|nr:twin-arginine translocase subunit TatC [Rhodospirillaceae bacterium R-7]